jgi:DNA repair protein RecO (recombination protein O)
MEWTDEGIILGSRRHGEGHAVVELMTAAHGRHLGLVRGGGSAGRRCCSRQQVARCGRD